MSPRHDVRALRATLEREQALIAALLRVEMLRAYREARNAAQRTAPPPEAPDTRPFPHPERNRP